jgi:hypothetical protein
MSMDFLEEDIEDLKMFVKHTRQVICPFWVLEPWIEEHSTLCGGPGDGSMTTFVLPIRSYSSIYGIYDDNVFVDSYSYTLHPTANFMSNDNEANFATSVGSWAGYLGSTTVARYLGDAVDGRACLKVTQSATANSGAAKTLNAVAGDSDYTFHAFFKGSGTFKIAVTENGTGTPTTTSTGITGDPSAWQQESVAVSTVSDSTYVTIKLIRVESTAATWFTACVGYALGDNVRWFLPSVAPSLVEFDTAPANGSRITAVGKGYLMTRVAIDRGGFDWAREVVGHAVPRPVNCMEVVER